jgi:Uma2 family endonuclease
MEASRSAKRWTYAEFARLPTSGSTRYEVIDDDLVVTPAPGLRHHRIVKRLSRLLDDFVSIHGLGEVFGTALDVLFADGDYLEPDILFVRTDHLHLLTERGVTGPPDLVVEVLSPSTADRDRGIKLQRYRHYGVGEYWVVDPDARSIEIWHFATGAHAPAVHGVADTLRWTPGPGGPTLEIAVAELFAMA